MAEQDERCGGTGLISYWDGSAYIGEGCPGCIDCEPPDDLLNAPCGRCGDPACFGGCEVGTDA